MKHVLCLSWPSKFMSLLLVMLSCLSATAQVNSGSNGSDGPFNPTGNVTINMADHPDGIYHYTSVNIPSGVTVTFTSNANNTPVVWLVQTNCVINGIVSLNAAMVSDVTGGIGGPGGGRGGNGGSLPTRGYGLGGGSLGFGGAFAEPGVGSTVDSFNNSVYGNSFLVPIRGGSGAGGRLRSFFSNQFFSTWYENAGGGGGGGILIAASERITLGGQINARGAAPNASFSYNAYGSGGGVRLVAPTISGGGSIDVAGGGSGPGYGGKGRIRFDALEILYAGSVNGSLTQGFQPIIIPASGQGVQLAIQSIGGVSVAGSPNGVLANPDVILPAQQTNPMNVVVNCSNLPMNTTITITVRPANGADIVATGTNNSGTPTASTATIPVTMPRGGGIIFAKCVSGVAGSASVSGDDYGKNIAQTGWTAHGERFAQMEITAGIGSSQQVAYITESGKRYALSAQ